MTPEPMAIHPLAAALLQVLLQSTLPGCLGLLALWALPRTRPALRCMAARAVLCGVALSVGCIFVAAGRLPTFWTVSLRGASFPPMQPRPGIAAFESNRSTIRIQENPSIRVSARSDLTVEPDGAPSSDVDSRVLRATPRLAQRPDNAPVVVRRSSRTHEDAASKSRQAGGITGGMTFVTALREKSNLVIGVWLAGAFTGLIWLTAGFIGVWRVRRATVALEGDAAQLHELAGAARVRVPLLLEGEATVGPFLCGIWRPAIVLPSGFANRFGASALRAVLAHEIAHLKRRDLLWQMAAQLGCVLLWPQPLMWLLLRQLEAAQEDACDQAVLRAGCAPHDYAACLLDLAERLHLTAPRMARLGVSASRSGLSRRVRDILSDRTPEGDISGRARILAALGVTLGVMASVSLVGAQTPAPEAVADAASSSTAPTSTPTASTLPAREEVLAVTFSPNGRLLASSASEGEIRIYDARTRRLKHTLRGKSDRIYALAWSPDGGTLANSNGELWDTRTWKVRERVPFAVQEPKRAYELFNVSVAFSPDGNLLASGGKFRTLLHRENGHWRLLRREPSRDWIYALAFSPKDKLLAEGSMNHLSLWDTKAARLGTLTPAVPGLGDENEKQILRLLHSYQKLSKEPDLAKRATQEANIKAKIDEAKVHAAITLRLTAGGGVVEEVAWSPDGSYLAIAYAGSADSEGSSLVINSHVPKVFRSLSTKGSGKVVVWKVKDGSLKQLLMMPGASASSLAWSPDGRILAAGEGELVSRERGQQKHEIKLWDMESGRVLRVLQGHTSQVNSLSWSPDGATLASGSRDKSVRLWPVADLVPSTKQAPPTALRDTPVHAIESFYNALNGSDAEALIALLWARPIGGVDLSGVDLTISELQSHPLKLGISGLKVENFGDEARAHFLVLASRDVAKAASNKSTSPLERVALGSLRADLRRDADGWKLREEPASASVGGAEIVGRVVDEDGNPLAGVGVMARITPSSQAALGRRLKNTISRRRFYRLLNTLDETRADGTFRLTGLTSGRYTIVIADVSDPTSGSNSGPLSGLLEPRPQSVVLTDNTRTKAADIRLARGVRVRGRVIDLETRQALRDVLVEGFNRKISEPFVVGQIVFIGSSGCAAPTDAQGRFEITLPPGNIRLNLATRTKSSVSFFEIRSGGALYTFGNGAEVVIDGGDPQRLLEGALPLKTVKGQTLEIEFRLKRSKPAPKAKPVATRPKAAFNRAQIARLLRPAGTVFGRVTYDDGRPVRAKVRVEAVGDEADKIEYESGLSENDPLRKRLFALVPTKADGSFEARNLPLLPHQVRIWTGPQGWVSRTIKLQRLAPRQRVRAPDVVLTHGALVKVRLLDRDTGELLKGNIDLGYSTDSKIHPVLQGSLSIYAPQSQLPTTTIAPGNISVGLWRNPDGSRPVREALLIAPNMNRFARTYDLSDADIEVALDAGPRQSKRDGQVSFAAAPGQTHTVTFFLRRIRQATNAR